MNHPNELDSFETALLTELRREVTEHPAPLPAPRRAPRRRLKVVAAGAVATAAATVVAVGLTGGGPTASPAFAVAGNPDGSVEIVIHELDDADGLEAALADHGIDATVHFVPLADGGFVPEPEVDGSYGASFESCGIDNGPGPATMVPSGEHFDGEDQVLQIPADSPLFDRPVILDIGSPRAMSLAYPSADGGLWCFFGQGPVTVVDHGASKVK